MLTLFEARVIMSLADLRMALWLSVVLQSCGLCVLLWLALLVRRRQ